MGFVSRPLYLFPQFFNDKATEHLFGEGIYPEYFNDDKRLYRTHHAEFWSKAYLSRDLEKNIQYQTIKNQKSCCARLLTTSF